MSHPLLEIRNVQLGYVPGKPVLHIDHLQIPKGKMVFVTGPSGSGKSTLLEFLGLMSNTCVNPGDATYHMDGGEGKRIELHRIWSASDEEISQVRRDHFSFVFQSTNLMPNFTIGENMCFGLMMNGMRREEAVRHTRALMEDLDLPASLFDKRIEEASGGQRQRIAFVRAFSLPFTILFGDEPTGNLDEGNAERLMRSLRSNVQRLNRSAIIVSHDLKLAREFADLILEIELDGPNGLNALNAKVNMA
jgi:ABC-type lipoprotein export system ATPase subunit